ncbi:MAG: hypothetical protein HQL14_02905 [Candidatus Omnitrophica bacterium]|nr:hypothetical protein [Candidatus Omnitrophota bacterium]
MTLESRFRRIEKEVEKITHENNSRWAVVTVDAHEDVQEKIDEYKKIHGAEYNQFVVIKLSREKHSLVN